MAQGYGRQGSFWEELWRLHFQAILCLASGHVEEYCHLCERLRDQYTQDLNNPPVASLVAGACGLAPEGTRDPALLVRMVERALNAQRHKPTPQDLYLLGLVYYRAGRFEEAVRCLSDPAFEQGKSCVLLAMALHRTGHVEEARKWLAKADGWLDQVTRDVVDAPFFSLPLWGWQELAKLQILHREAAVLIAGSARNVDANWKALQARAREELKRRTKATADYDHALGLSPDQPRLWLARGRRFAELKQWDKAAADLAKAAELKPDDPGVWRERGCIYAEFGQPDKAAADFAKALALLPTSDDPWFEPWWDGRAAILEDLACWDEVFDRVAKQRPKDSHLWIARANHFGRYGQWQQAATALARVLDRDPSDPVAWSHSAAVRLQLGDVEGYRQACRVMLTRFGQTNDSAIAARIIQTCLLLPHAVSDLKRVRNLADQAVTDTAKLDRSRWLLLARGRADYRDGRLESAMSWLERSLAADHDSAGPALDATAHLFLAIARHQLGQAVEARRALDRACQMMASKTPGDADLHWGDWLRFQILRREALTVLNETATNLRTRPRP
jgi:tetratricopeptide (TPR) repeat protein